MKINKSFTNKEEFYKLMKIAIENFKNSEKLSYNFKKMIWRVKPL